MKIWTRGELYQNNNLQYLVAPGILIVEEEDEASSDFQGCTLNDWVGLLNNRFVASLLNISGNLRRLGLE